MIATIFAALAWAMATTFAYLYFRDTGRQAKYISKLTVELKQKETNYNCLARYMDTMQQQHDFIVRGLKAQSERLRKVKAYRP